MAIVIPGPLVGGFSNRSGKAHIVRVSDREIRAHNGRFVAGANRYDGLTSARPSQRARSEREARRLLEQEPGPHLDPVVVSALITSPDAHTPRPVRALD